MSEHQDKAWPPMPRETPPPPQPPPAPMVRTSRVELLLDVELTQHEKELVKYILTDALSEFMGHRNVEVQRAGTEDDAEYYVNYGADSYVAKRYPWMSDAQKKAKADQVRQRCRVAAILNHAAFSVEVK